MFFLSLVFCESLGAYFRSGRYVLFSSHWIAHRCGFSMYTARLYQVGILCGDVYYPFYLTVLHMQCSIGYAICRSSMSMQKGLVTRRRINISVPDLFTPDWSNGFGPCSGARKNNTSFSLHAVLQLCRHPKTHKHDQKDRD